MSEHENANWQPHVDRTGLAKREARTGIDQEYIDSLIAAAGTAGAVAVETEIDVESAA